MISLFDILVLVSPILYQHTQCQFYDDHILGILDTIYV